MKTQIIYLSSLFKKGRHKYLPPILIVTMNFMIQPRGALRENQDLLFSIYYRNLSCWINGAMRITEWK